MNREKVKEFVELAKELDSWKEHLQPTYKEKGVVVYKKFDYNVAQAVNYHPLLRGKLAFNEFTQSICWVGEPPFEIGRKRERELRTRGYIELEETDISKIIYLLSAEFHWTLSKEKVIDSIKALAVERSFHPLRDYLNSLTWDGKPRLKNWLSVYLGAEDNEYNRLVGRFFLLSAVARVFTPGCKQDLLFILEGKQGKKKSTALRVLAGEEWFTDTPVNIENKDFFLQIRGKWIVELAELDALLRSEPSRIKAILSTGTDRYRPPYGRKAVDVPRSCIFTGTSNLYEYIKDYSGGRRFIPIRVGEINIPLLMRDREQLLAEAKHSYLYGSQEEKRYYPIGEEYKLLNLEQELREEPDPWVNLISEWVGSKETVTTVEVLRDCLGFTEKEIKRGHSTRVGMILLNKLGWRKKRTSRGMVYYKPKGGRGNSSGEGMKRVQPVKPGSPGKIHSLTLRDKSKNVTCVTSEEKVFSEFSVCKGDSILGKIQNPSTLATYVTQVTFTEENQVDRYMKPPVQHLGEVTFANYRRRNIQLTGELTNNGFLIIPLERKQPHRKYRNWKEVKENFTAYLYDELFEDWGRGEEESYPNIGVCCGRTKNRWHLVVIDVDDENLAEELERKNLLPPTAKVKTGRGYHYYYRYYGEETRGRNLRSLGVDIEIKGEGQYVVAPPSIYSSGREYRWESPLSLMSKLPDWAVKMMFSVPKREGEKKKMSEEVRKKRDKNIPSKRSKHSMYWGRTIDLDYVRKEMLSYYSERVSQSGNGTRNDMLNRWTYELAGLAERYNLTEGEVFSKAIEACEINGLIRDDGMRSVERTFKSAWEKGVRRPMNREPSWLIEIKKRSEESISNHNEFSPSFSILG